MSLNCSSNLHKSIMTQSELHFEPTVYTRHDGTQTTFEINDERRIDMILKELSAIYQREEKRPLGYQQLPYHGPELVLEAIGLLERAIEWDEPTDEDLGYGSEPPITMDEMHTAAWKEHQEAHR
jgi:hypothetical protein